MGEPVRLVVHGHFYQPPRENPWTEEVPVEPSAAPFHDWNERITAECYRPNGWARVVDEHGRVAGVVDNYEHLSFDLGPTLASWLERHHPDVLARMVEGDRAGGGGMAQAYNHIILPLADDRDVRTQVRWGLADFAHRFGRPTDAMWLPEAAVDERVLRLLAEEGVRATILAPGQAATPIVEGVPHRWVHPERQDLYVDLVFYDGPLSHELAFALTGLSSHDLIDRVRAAGDEGAPVVVAADGETFGHHHRWADRSLAYAFAHEAPERDVRVLGLAALLDEVPPVDGVEVRRSSWSCAHGVERWRSDCGCQTGGEPWWSQAWREPLRHALDVLRDHSREVFDRRGGAVFTDPWAARDGYIDVLLGIVDADAYVAVHGCPDGGEVVDALSLLELQRQTMLMYTSCGWFFNDLAGLETVQVLRYAARAMDLLEELAEPARRDEFLAVLGEARSNRPEEGTGIDIWRTHVEPSRVDAGRVVAHLALLDLLEQQAGGPHIGGHEVVHHERRRLRRGGYRGVSGRVELAHRRTGRRTAHVYAAVRLGGLEVAGAVRPADEERDDQAFARLAEVAEQTDRVTAVLRVIVDAFGPREFGLEAALPEAAGAIVASTADALADRFAGAFARMWEDNRSLLGALAMAGHPLSPELRMPIGFALARRVQQAMGVVASETADDVDLALAAVAEAAEAAAEARRLRVTGASDHEVVAVAVGQAVLAATRRAIAEPAHVDVVLALVRLRRALDIGVDVDRAQELVVDADGPEHVARLAAALGVAGSGR